MSDGRRAQRLCWESALERAGRALADPAPRATRLRACLRMAAASLQECMSVESRAITAADNSARRAGRCESALTSLVEQLPIPCVTTTRMGLILTTNPAAAAALNVSARALPGRNLLLFFDNRDGWQHLLSRIKERDTARQAGHLRPRERMPMPLTATLAVVPGTDSDCIRWFLMATVRAHPPATQARTVIASVGRA